jgi:hypothetical protein
MTISLSSASLPVFAKFLGNLRHLLTKAQADVQAKAKTTMGGNKCFICRAFVVGAGALSSSRWYKKSGSRHPIGSPA